MAPHALSIQDEALSAILTRALSEAISLASVNHPEAGGQMTVSARTLQLTQPGRGTSTTQKEDANVDLISVSSRLIRVRNRAHRCAMSGRVWIVETYRWLFGDGKRRARFACSALLLLFYGLMAYSAVASPIGASRMSTNPRAVHDSDRSSGISTHRRSPHSRKRVWVNIDQTTTR
jgi:hypothetical protein